MYLHKEPGVWVPLSKRELARAEELLDRIANLMQRAPRSKRYAESLDELKELIGEAAASEAADEAEERKSSGAPPPPMIEDYTLWTGIKAIGADLRRRLHRWAKDRTQGGRKP